VHRSESRQYISVLRGFEEVVGRQGTAGISARPQCRDLEKNAVFETQPVRLSEKAFHAVEI
jgi:hypothetical protein